MSDDKEIKSKAAWEALIFGAIEKLAAAPGKLRDPKETMTSAFEWMKSTRDEVQEKFISDLTEKLSKVNWEFISKQVGEQLVTKYDIEVTARVSLKPKTKVVEAPIPQEKPQDQDQAQPGME